MSTFTVVRHGDGPVVVTVDFGQSRAEGEIADLAANLVEPNPVWQVVPPGLRGVRPAVAPDTYLDCWLNGLSQAEVEVAAVIGYCAGGLLACGLADRLAQMRTATPTVIALNTQPEVDLGYLLDEFARSLGTLRPVMTEDERRSVEAGILAARSSSITEAAWSLDELYARVSTGPMRRLGLPSESVDTLTGRVSAWLRYLGSAARHPLRAEHADLHMIVSTDFPDPAAIMDPVVVDAGAVDLLRSPATAAAVDDLLRARRLRGSADADWTLPSAGVPDA